MSNLTEQRITFSADNYKNKSEIPRVGDTIMRVLKWMEVES